MKGCSINMYPFYMLSEDRTMAKLEILTVGYDVEIVCGEISVKARDKIITYCTNGSIKTGNDISEELSVLWYYKEDKINEIMGTESRHVWWEYYDYLQEYGNIWDEKIIDIRISIDGNEIIFNRDMLKYNKRIEPKPKPRKDYVLISSGAVGKGSQVYTINIDGIFDINQLEIELTDFTHIGYSDYVITDIYYNDDSLEGNTTGSNWKYMLDVIFHEYYK